MRILSDSIRIRFANKVMRKHFPNNSIRIGKYTNHAGIQFCLSKKLSIDKGSYGLLNVHSSGVMDESLIIGRYCQISGDSHFLLSGEHRTDWATTFPVRELILHEGLSAFSKGPIQLEDEVWIGQNALILSGVTIGKGAVVAAGAVVVKNVPSYAIVGGSPAHIIKMRFSDKVIAALMQLQIPYEDLNPEDLEFLEKKIDDENITELIEHFKLRGLS